MRPTPAMFRLLTLATALAAGAGSVLAQAPAAPAERRTSKVVKNLGSDVPTGINDSAMMKFSL